jgi:FkbM family methyltransferase
MIVSDAGIRRKVPHALGILGLYKRPWIRVLDYLGRLSSGKTYRLGLWNGVRFHVRPGTGDLPIIDEIFIHRVYDRALSRIRHDERVIDIGASIGVFAIAAAARGAQVLCFEPLRDNFDALLSNIRLNGFEERMSAYRMAVAGSAGELELHVIGDRGASTAFPAIHPAWSARPDVKTIRVECTTLSDMFRVNGIDRCDCLKVDCEGAEYEIFASVDDDTLRRIRRIIMEYHPNGEIRDIGRRLEKLDFEVEVTPKTATMFAWRR